MDSEKKVDAVSVPKWRVQSAAPKGNVSKQISSHRGHSTQALSRLPAKLHVKKNRWTDAEIPKHTSLTSVTDVNKHIRVKINLKELTKNKTIRGILKKARSTTDTMHRATNSSAKHDLYDQKASNRAQINIDTANQMNRDMPVIQDFIEKTEPSTSQRKFELLKVPVANGNSFVTFSFEKNVVKMDDGHILKTIKPVPNRMKHHDKTSKRKNPNLYLSGPFVVCSIRDKIKPEVPEGEVDREQNSLVIVPNMLPRNNKQRIKKLSFKVQYRLSLQSKVLSDALPDVKSIEPVKQPKRQPSLSVTSDIDDYNSSFAVYDNISRYMKIALLTIRPLDFLIPMTASNVNGYSKNCVAQKIRLDPLSVYGYESLIANGIFRYEVVETPVNCGTINEEGIGFNVHKHRKRHSNEDIRYVNKRKRLPELENRDTTITNNLENQICDENDKESSASNLQNKKEKQGTKSIKSKRSKKVPQEDFLKTDGDHRIINSPNSTEDAIKKHQKDSSLFEGTNSDLTENSKCSKEMLALKKNKPWDYILRTGQNVKPASVELLQVNWGKSLEKTNNAAVSEVVDEGEDNVLEAQHASDTSLSDLSDCSMVTVPETNEAEKNNDEIVLDECDTVPSENTEEDDYKIEIGEGVDSFLDNAASYLIPNDGSIWEITIDDSGAVIYENIAVDTKCIIDGDDIKVENPSMYEGEYQNLNTEYPLVDIIEPTENDIESELCEEEKIAEKDVESNLIDEEHITVSEAETELFDEEIVVKTELLNKDDDGEENTVKFNIISLSNEENPEELESGAQVVDKEQTVNTDVERNPSNEEISTELLAGHYSHNAHQTAKFDSRINNNTLHNQPAEKSNVSNNCEYNERANSSPDINQHELNVQTHRTDQDLMKGVRSTPEIRRTSATSFEIRFNNTCQTIVPYRQHQIEMEKVLKESNINNEMLSHSQKKAGKIKILEDTMLKSNVSSASAKKKRMSMVSRNTIKRTKGQSVTKQLQKSVIINHYQPVYTVPQQSVITVPQQSVITVPQQSVITVPQQQVITVPQQQQQPMTRVPVTTVTNLQATRRNESGKLCKLLLTGNNQGTEQQNNGEKHLQTSMQNNNLLIQHSAQNVQHQQNEPTTRENHGDIINIITLNSNDISVKQYNEIKVSHMPLQENNMVAQNPVIQHTNQMSMLSNNLRRPIEYTRNVATVDHHNENTLAQMSYQGKNIISQSSNQHFGILQNANHQMLNNHGIQSGQYQPRRYTSYKEMNVPSMDLPGTGIVVQQNSQGQVITNHQSITEPTGNGPIHSTQGETYFNKGGTLGANNINMKNPSLQPVNNVVVPFRKNNNLSPRNAPLQQNVAAINKNLQVYQPGRQNHLPHLPPPYPGHLLQQNTQVQSGTLNNIEHATSLETVRNNCVSTNIMYRQIMMQQQSQIDVMRTTIMELKETIKTQTTNAPRRGGRKKANEAIPPAVQNYSPQRFLENTGQQVYPVSHVSPENHGLKNRPPGNDSQKMHPVPYIPTEQQYLQYRNRPPVQVSQQVHPGPHILPEERGLTYRNRPPGNDSQQMHPVPHIPSEQQYLQYRNRPPVQVSQQVHPGPHVLPEEPGLIYRNHPTGNDSQQVHPPPRVPAEDQYLKYQHRPPVKDSQQVYPVSHVSHVPAEGNSFKYPNRPPGMDSQQIRPVSRVPLEEYRLKYINQPPVQRHTQERHQLTSHQPAGSAQNVTSAPSENTHYPKPVAVGSQNIPVIQPSALSGTSYHQQGSHAISIYSGPVRNEATVKLQDLHADKMHVQGNLPDPSHSRNNNLFKIEQLCKLDNDSTALHKSSVDQLSNDGPLNLSIRDNTSENRSQQNNNVSNEPYTDNRKNNNHAEYEYIDLEILDKQIQKKQGTGPRNESRDSGFIASPREGDGKHIVCLRCYGHPFFKCSVCGRTFYCSIECQDVIQTIDESRCCWREIKPKPE